MNRFYPVSEDGGITIEPVDRNDELRGGPNPYLADSITYRITLNPAVVDWYRRQLWDSARFLVALGLLHPFTWYEGYTAQPVTAATWPG